MDSLVLASPSPNISYSLYLSLPCFQAPNRLARSTSTRIETKLGIPSILHGVLQEIERQKMKSDRVYANLR